MKALRARAGRSPSDSFGDAARLMSKLPGWYIAYGALALFNVALLIFSLWLNSREAHLLDAAAKTYGLYADLLERVNEVAQISVAADASTKSQRMDAVAAVLAATRTIRNEQLAAIRAQRREANEAQKLVAALAMVAVLLTLAAAAHALHVHRAMRKQAAVREHATRQLARAQEQAKQATRAKAQFLATMSHEIRTPMNGVLGMLDALSTTALSHAQASLLEAANSSSDLLLSVIDAVLDFSLIDAGMLAIRNAPLDVRELAQRAIDVHAAQAREKKLSLKLEMPESLPTVMSDALRLSQVLGNLLSNAVKFTAAGTVTLRLEVLDEAAAALRIKFSAQDTGIGIDVEQQSKLFAPFTQGDASSNRRYGGIGLGLAICKQLTQLLDPHSGEIGVTSALDAGSNFFVILRFAKAADQSTTRPASIAQGSGVRCQKFVGHVLVAEDNETNRQVVVAMLRNLGLQMTLVGNGREAIEAVQRERYDIILMDYHMPELDGCDATAGIRRYEHEHTRARTPIIAVTASVLASDRERCFAAGMDDFVAKPLRQQMLVAVLEKWLPEDARREVDEPHDVSTDDPLGCTWTNLPVELFDLEQLLEMRAIAGESFDELVEQFHGSAVGGLASLRNAVENHDWVALKRAAHKLKGAAATLGAKLVATRCHSLEAASKDQSMDAAVEHLRCLEQEYSAVRRHMSACVSACAQHQPASPA